MISNDIKKDILAFFDLTKNAANAIEANKITQTMIKPIILLLPLLCSFIFFSSITDKAVESVEKTGS